MTLYLNSSKNRIGGLVYNIMYSKDNVKIRMSFNSIYMSYNEWIRLIEEMNKNGEYEMYYNDNNQDYRIKTKNGITKFQSETNGIEFRIVNKEYIDVFEELLSLIVDGK